MKAQCVLNEGELLQKKKIIERNKIKRSINPVSPLSSEELDRMSFIVKAYKKCFAKEMRVEEFINADFFINWKSLNRQRDSNSYSSESDVKFEVVLRNQSRQIIEISIDMEKILHLADVATSMTFDVVNFVKEVPDFKQLDEQDQVIIIRNAAVEVHLLNICDFYNCEKGQIEIGQCSYPVHKLTAAGVASSFLEKFQKFVKSIYSLQLREEEKALALMIILFSEDRGSKAESLSQIQESYAMTLKEILDARRGAKSKRNIFAELMFLLSELRRLSVSCRPYLIAFSDSCHDQLNPVLREIFSPVE
ncbi:Oidioi.mRNA.OKI2018_I69.PAR.g9985.t1.cds [Oikopleura dioica]|uniref:Oidioi.mRNA.OKI2018_I69.PAR.g9985.t1.cds n=1 Tax=Oikopleura dioica TaxID=34765 RepID=A0ABN7RNC3_OIKDI|nr:Oidioi.mRNA.OKI2018_I69.PAR.g9985.t1.cds [Oikopleura dioica]